MRSAVVAGLITAAVCCNVAAQPAFPQKPVTLVVPYAPGGPVDIVARILGKGLGDLWGKTVIVENRDGAGGNIGSAQVARAKPDGYTLLINTPALVITPSVVKSVPFDPIKSFSAITKVGYVPGVLMVGAAAPFKSVGELVAYGKAHPGALAFGSPGTGTSLHLAGELFAQLAGISATHIPYRGSSQAISDLIGGRLQFQFDSMVGAHPQIQAGTVRGLAVTTLERSPQLPDTPTMQQAGVKDYEFSLWYGVFGPANMSADLAATISADFVKVLDKPEIRKQLMATGLTLTGNSPPAFAKEVASEFGRWASLAQKIGLKLDN